MNHQSNETIKKQLNKKGWKPFRATSPPNPHLTPSHPSPFPPKPPTMNNPFLLGFDQELTNLATDREDELGIPLPAHPFADQVSLVDPKDQGAAGMVEELTQSTKPLTPQQRETCNALVERGRQNHGGDFKADFDQVYPMQQLKAIEDALPNELNETDAKENAANGMAEELASETIEVQQPVEDQPIFMIEVPKPSHTETLTSLDPTYIPSQYVFHHEGTKPFTEIKVNKTVQLQLKSEPLDHQWVFIGIFHSHPDYAKFPIINPQDDVKTPFNIRMPKSRSLIYSEVKIQEHEIPMHGAFVLLQNENEINLDFNVNSTDKSNCGGKKDGKEWFQILVPLTSERVEDLVNKSAVLTLEDLVHHSIVRVQIREEIRRTQLAKPRSAVEVTFALPPSIKKQRWEAQIIQAKLKKIKAELSQMNIQQLKAQADQMGLKLA